MNRYLKLAAAGALFGILAACQAETTQSASAVSADTATAAKSTAATSSGTLMLPFRGQSTITSGGRFGPADEMRFTFFLTKINGKVGVCGSYASNIRDHKGVTRQMLRNYQIRWDGNTLMTGIYHFTKGTFGQDLRDTKATCRVGSVPWSDNYKDLSKVSTSLKGSGRYRL